LVGSPARARTRDGVYDVWPTSIRMCWVPGQRVGNEFPGQEPADRDGVLEAAAARARVGGVAAGHGPGQEASLDDGTGSPAGEQAGDEHAPEVHPVSPSAGPFLFSARRHKETGGWFEALYDMVYELRQAPVKRSLHIRARYPTPPRVG